jgi:hypothetical protein
MVGINTSEDRIDVKKYFLNKRSKKRAMGQADFINPNSGRFTDSMNPPLANSH